MCNENVIFLFLNQNIMVWVLKTYVKTDKKLFTILRWIFVCLSKTYVYTRVINQKCELLSACHSKQEI